MKTPPLVRVQFVIKLIGLAVILGYCVATGQQQIREHWLLALLILGLQAATQIMPFAITHNGSRDEVTPDQIVVVAAALLLPTAVAVIAFTVGQALGYVLRREIHLYRLDDVGNATIGVFLSLSLAHAIGQPGLGVNSIAGAVIAGLLFDPFTLLTITIVYVLNDKVKFWSFFRDGLISSAIAYPWLISLGILLGVIGWDALWALPLMAAPLALVFMASRSRIEATEDRTRLDGLLIATTEILAATTVASVTEAATSSASALFDVQKGRIDTDGPTETELGVTFNTDSLGTRHLIVPNRPALMRAYSDQDLRLLETLASVTASALDKAALHEDVTEQATRDALTGLANRRAFEAELASSVMAIVQRMHLASCFWTWMGSRKSTMSTVTKPAMKC